MILHIDIRIFNKSKVSWIVDRAKLFYICMLMHILTENENYIYK